MFFPECEGPTSTLMQNKKSGFYLCLIQYLRFLEIKREQLYVTCGNAPSALKMSGTFIE
jgi:hypothetical protein